MRQRNGTYTFDALTELPKGELDGIMQVGATPAIEDVLGYEFRGWNLQRLPVPPVQPIFPPSAEIDCDVCVIGSGALPLRCSGVHGWPIGKA